MSDATFHTFRRGPFELHALSGTAAERDMDRITARREAARESITTALAFEHTASITYYLSPNRVAAKAHGRRGGATFENGHIEVLYLDDPDSYEQQRWGHELTHALAQSLDASSSSHLKLIEEGLAEYFDQSERDLHLAFAQEVRSGERSLEASVRPSISDAENPSYGKAGSFVRAIFDLDANPDAFKAFYGALAVTWDGDVPSDATGAALDASRVESMIDAALQSTYGIGWTDFATRWRESLAPYLDRPSVSVAADDREAIEALVAARDAAITAGDANAYRATLGAFYCDRQDEASLAKEASRAATGVRTHTTIDEIIDRGIQNYRIAFVRAHEDRDGQTRPLGFMVERYPIGWRIQSQE